MQLAPGLLIVPISMSDFGKFSSLIWELSGVAMVVAFSSRARILGECSKIHSPPAVVVFFVFVFFSLG